VGGDAEWKCGGCGTQNRSGTTRCWSCGGAAPAAEALPIRRGAPFYLVVAVGLSAIAVVAAFRLFEEWPNLAACVMFVGLPTIWGGYVVAQSRVRGEEASRRGLAGAFVSTTMVVSLLLIGIAATWVVMPVVLMVLSFFYHVITS
jgi:hypothetical protein